MVNATDGWAVGSDGKIIHWNGTMWNFATSQTTAHLLSVCMVNATDGWAVGYYGEIVRWNGTDWIIPEFPTIIPISLLTSLTLVAVTIVKTVSKKRRNLSSLNKTERAYLHFHKPYIKRSLYLICISIKTKRRLLIWTSGDVAVSYQDNLCFIFQTLSDTLHTLFNLFIRDRV